MIKMTAVETIDFIVNYLAQNNPLSSEMTIYGDNLSKLLSLKEILIGDKELELIKTADMDIINIQNFIIKEHITTTTVERENGDFETLFINNESDFIQRVE